MENARNYVSFIWHNQTIDKKMVDFVRVRVYLRNTEVVCDKKLEATDGKVFTKSPRGYKKYISNYSYVVISSDILEKGFYYSSNNPKYLHMKVCLTEDFDFSKLENEDFLGKSYVIEAITQYLDGKLDIAENAVSEPESVLTPMLKYLQKKVGADYENFYNHLKNSAQVYDYDKVEELFETYKISIKYQALFWKEMYQEIAKKEAIAMRENWSNFKFRWTGLLGSHPSHPRVATINVKIYQKNCRFFMHVDDLMYTDGYIRYDFVHDFSYAIVGKYIERTEDPETYHLDIKIYLAFDFNPKRLPEISDFWGEYVREAIEQYNSPPKTLP